MTPGQSIRRARIQAQMSQTTLGAILGRSQNWISRIERDVDETRPDVLAHVLLAIDRVKQERDKRKPTRPIFSDLRLPTRLEAANGF
jgi:transcriptional regulator with XRE-family HTH domain